MASLRRVLPGLFLAVCLSAACSSAKKRAGGSSNKTAAQFCESFGKAACNEAVVDACSGGGTDVEACISAQQNFCLSQLTRPEQYSADNAQACLDAVEAAYDDAKLSADEVEVVRNFGAPCNELIRGPGTEGMSCFQQFDCNTLEGLTCVKKVGQNAGTCQIPEIVGGGFSCTGQNQTCADGFYCDGTNCLAAPNQPGASCNPDSVPCSPEFNCLGTDPDYSCQPKGDLGASCTMPTDCKSSLCSVNTCVNQIILAFPEPICQDLR